MFIFLSIYCLYSVSLFKGQGDSDPAWFRAIEQDCQIGGEMNTELEKQIRYLQKELAEVQMEQAALRLQPCRGDSEIKKKEAKFDELDRRAKTINETIRDLTKKFQLLNSQSATRRSYDSPSSSNSS
jgi:chromosome segregation ATPase